MAEPSTYIKLDRAILNWGWYQEPNTMRLFIHLLLRANVRDKEWMGCLIHRGELATSYQHLAKELNLSVQNVRTALSHLQLTGEVTSKNNSHFSIISISNYDKYQLDNTPVNNQLTSNQQATNKPLTTTKEINNKRNNKDIYKEFADDEEMVATLKAFEEMRIKKKDPLTDRAKELLIIRLKSLSTDRDTQLAILNQSILNNWKGIYEIKENVRADRFNNGQQTESGDIKYGIVF